MKTSVNSIIIAVSTCAGLVSGVSCQPENSIGQTPSSVIKDLSYGSDPSQRMDVYLPDNRSVESTPAIVFVHGGAWVSGDKAEFNDAIKVLQKQLGDYAMFNINYRLSNFNGKNSWPAQIEDVDSAISFIKAKADEFKFNRNKIVLIGASAGAHLALLQAYANNSNQDIKVVVDLFGPADIVDLYNYPPDPALPNMLAFFMNGTPSGVPARYQAASPIYHITPQSPPTIIFHGKVDPVVPLRQSDNLHKQLQEAGVPNLYVTYEGEGHGWTGSKLVDTYDKAVKFIRQYMN